MFRKSFTIMKFKKKSIFALSILSGFLFLNLLNVNAYPLPKNYYKLNFGFDLNGISEDTGTRFNYDGFTWDGFYRDTRQKFDHKGLDIDRYDFKGLPCSSWLGYGEDGFNHRGFNKYAEHRNGTMYDDEGYDYVGFHKDTKINKYTGTEYDARGYDVNHRDRFGFLDLCYFGCDGAIAPPPPELPPVPPYPPPPPKLVSVK